MGNAWCMPSPWTDASNDLSDIIQNAQTGDLILFEGRGPDAMIIRLASLSPWWSHVGVVLRDAQNRLFITEEYPTVIGPEQMRQPLFHTGAQVVPLVERLKTYPSGKFAWRRLYVTTSTHQTEDAKVVHRHRLAQRQLNAMFDTFVRFFTQLSVIPKYNLNLADFVEYGTRTDPLSDDNDGKYVCTSWAARVLLVMGIFTPRQIMDDGRIIPTIPGNVLLSDFDGTGPLPLRHQYEYGELEYLVGPKEPWDVPAAA